jgi:hypothetical protein
MTENLVQTKKFLGPCQPLQIIFLSMHIFKVNLALHRSRLSRHCLSDQILYFAVSRPGLANKCRSHLRLDHVKGLFTLPVTSPSYLQPLPTHRATAILTIPLLSR